MMKKLLLCVVSAMVMAFTGCSSDDELTPEKLTEKITTYTLPQQLVNKDELPTWIAERIDNIDPMAYVQMSVDRFVWKNKTYYYFQTIYSQFLTQIYDEEGNMIELMTGTEREELLRNSHDWVCIYMYSTIE